MGRRQTRRGFRWAVGVVAASALLLTACGSSDDGAGSSSEGNRIRVASTNSAATMTIWIGIEQGIFEKNGVVEWDLGAQENTGGLRLQADNKDLYSVDGSLDGEHWFKIWGAGPVDLPGVQTRTSSPLRAIARYLRVTASGRLASITGMTHHIVEQITSRRQAIEGYGRAIAHQRF